MSDQLNPLGLLDPALRETSTNQTEKKKKNDEIGQNEFLGLLVAQLKAQDPLNPMENEEFAVQLAQFSQLEQLVAIKDALGAGDQTGEFGSMASYLGHEVTLNRETLDMQDGKGGTLKFEMRAPADDVRIELTNSTTGEVKRVDLGAVDAGEHRVRLAGLDEVANGEYKYQIIVGGSNGSPGYQPSVELVGVVDGFVPGPDAALIVDGREVQTSEISRVNLAPQV
ncbi:MAG: hypothetical protein KDD42_04805 [Bdellovibrionales bacterium]|nr:hypothetical protein [Bdellovibrionales bacterium]